MNRCRRLVDQFLRASQSQPTPPMPVLDARWVRLRPSKLRTELSQIDPADAERVRLFVADYRRARWEDIDEDEPVEAMDHRGALQFARGMDRERTVKRTAKPLGDCPRCGGHGSIRAFQHRAGGVCFACDGTGNIPILKFGSANVITDQGYHRTAISRDQPSIPLRHLQDHHPQLLQGRVLDFGSGRGSDCQAIKAHCYDPHHPKQSVRKSPTGTFDTVMMTYVVNVLPKGERAEAVKGAARMVRKGGSIVISARSKSDSGYQSAKAWTKHGDGYAKLTDQGTIQRFQRFYDGDELRLEMDALVGSGFQRIQIRPIGGHTEAVAYRRIR